MREGVVFDIKEFALNDGPGIMLTIFLKGCPLRCVWCHNPEGFLFEPQLNRMNGRITGKMWASSALVGYISGFRDIFNSSGGGVTFSGGEPIAQADFLLEVLDNLPGIHKNIDTSGFCPPDIFKDILSRCDLVFYDLKLGHNEVHKQYTGQPNSVIIENLKLLSGSNVPYHIRIPLIPGITDTIGNLESLGTIITTLSRQPEQIDLLSYNRLAGGKYGSYGLKYFFPGENEKIDDENVQSFIGNFKTRTNTRVKLMK
jgi:pyruvate formate lyase activating enzyme